MKLFQILILCLLGLTSMVSHADWGKPPEGYCLVKPGNVWDKDCDVLYSGITDAGGADISAQMQAQNHAGEAWTGPLTCGVFNGSNPISCTRTGQYPNPSYPGVTVNTSYTTSVVPHCSVVPVQNAFVRPAPGGTDEQTACKCPTGMNWGVGTPFPGITNPGSCFPTIDLLKYHPPQNCPIALGQPIYPLTGTKELHEDLGITIGRERLKFDYDTIYKVPYVAYDTTVNNRVNYYEFSQPMAGLGETWSHSLLKRIESQSALGSPYLVTFRIDGNWVSFYRSNYAPVYPGSAEKLSFDGTNYRLTLANGDVETYTTTDFVRKDYAAGGYIVANYGTVSGLKRLLSIVDDQGRSLVFAYDGAANLASIQAPNGSVVTVQVTSNGLSKITWPDAASRTYLYERDVLPNKLKWAVTGVVDENNSRLTTYTYDDQGYAIGTRGDGGVLAYDAAYTQKPGWTITSQIIGGVLYRTHTLGAPAGVEVTGPDGNSFSLGASVAGFGVGLASRSQRAGSGCNASTSNFSYDGNGNVASMDDFNGQRTCYAYDASNRETARVEGLANTVACSSVLPSGILPTGARKITTSWHPDYRGAAAVVAPGTTTTNVYQGQPDPFNNNGTINCTPAASLPNGKALPVTCKRVVQATLSAPQGAAIDATYDNVSLLIHADGANASTVFTDKSPTAKTITTMAGAKVSTAQSKFGGASAVFNGNGDYLKVAYGTELSLVSGDFTAEAWVYVTALTGSQAILDKDGVFNSSYCQYCVFISSTGKLLGFLGNGNGVSPSGTTYTGTTTVTLNAWHHVALVVSGGTSYGFLDGVQQWAAPKAAMYEGSKPLLIGYETGQPASNYFNGYIDEVRITKGVARYTTTFTPPAAAFADWGLGQKLDTSVPAVTSSYTYDSMGRLLTANDTANRTTSYAYYSDAVMDGQQMTPPAGRVSLLIHADGANGSAVVTDKSLTPKTLTLGGGATISTTQSKFGGASLKLNGTSDYLQLPNSADFSWGASDFTLEANVYINAYNANVSRLWNADGDYFDGLNVYIDDTGKLAVHATTNGTSWNYSFPTVATLATGQWYHIAVTRSGGTLRAFVNGTPYTLTTALGTTALYTDTTHARIIGGQSNGVNRSLNGYIDEFRITKGQALYAGAFTPPTAAFADPATFVAPTLTPVSKGHLVGDLQSITEPGGFVTTYNLYDPTGKVVQMTDAKGVVTDVTYNLRGLVKTSTTTAPGLPAKVTTYNYDNVGQVTGVIQPDGSTVTYTYDVAHRLTGVTDAKGNSISYTLDNMGNRTVDQLKDPQGVLQREVLRSFDALNRVQQVTGAPR